MLLILFLAARSTGCAPEQRRKGFSKCKQTNIFCTRVQTKSCKNEFPWVFAHF